MCDAKVAQVLSVSLVREDDACSVRLLGEGVGAVFQTPLEDVVSEHHHHAIAVNESLGEAEGLGDAARLLLVRIEQSLDAKFVAVAKQSEELARMRAAGYKHHLRHTRFDHGFDRVA